MTSAHGPHMHRTHKTQTIDFEDLSEAMVCSNVFTLCGEWHCHEALSIIQSLRLFDLL